MFQLVWERENEAVVPDAAALHVSYITMMHWRQKWEKDDNAMKI